MRTIENYQDAHASFLRSREDARRMIVFALLIMAVIMVRQFTGDSGTVSTSQGDEYLGVGGVDSSVFVYYDQITDVELVKQLDRGTFVDGVDGKKVWNGTYCNEAYGEYQLYAYENPQEYIVVKYSGGVLVYNCYRASDTEQAYRSLQEHLQKAE
jgi:hypothetical protein